MKLSAPKVLVFIIALILAAAGILLYLGVLDSVGFLAAVKDYAFWFVTAAYGLLFLGTLFKGL